MNKHSCVPVKLHLPKLAAGQIRPAGGHLLHVGADSGLAVEETRLTSTRMHCLHLPWAPLTGQGLSWSTVFAPSIAPLVTSVCLTQGGPPGFGKQSVSEAVTFLQVLSLQAGLDAAPFLPAPNVGEGLRVVSGAPRH